MNFVHDLATLHTEVSDFICCACAIKVHLAVRLIATVSKAGRVSAVSVFWQLSRLNWQVCDLYSFKNNTAFMLLFMCIHSLPGLVHGSHPLPESAADQPLAITYQPRCGAADYMYLDPRQW